MWKLLVVIGFSVIVRVSAESEAHQCVGAGCHLNGLQIVTKFVRQYLEHQPEDITLSDGVHLVNNGDATAADGARSADDGSLLSALEGFLKTHELRIRLPELMPNSENIGRTFREVINDMGNNDLGDARKGGGGFGGGGGGGGKKGNGGMMLMALMMGKMMAAIGFGTVGLLAMKALMVSALALMLSLIVGLKKLIGGGHDEGGHTVIHATAGGHEHRRKREAADMAYSAWTDYLKR